MTLALFDFDGTITRKDSLLHFTKFALGGKKYKAGMAMLLPVLVLHKMGAVSSQATKNIFLTSFFNNVPVKDFDNTCQQYAANQIAGITYKAAMEKIQWHKQQQHRVIVVSASPEAYLKPWCTQMGIECIGTKLQTKDGAITGKIDGANCNGKEKASRIKSYLNITDYKDIFGYGNSKGDNAMLALCTQTFYRPFEQSV